MVSGGARPSGWRRSPHGESCARRGVRVRSNELSRSAVASGENNFAGIIGSDGADGFDGGERDRCRGVTCDRGSAVVDSRDGGTDCGSGVVRGIDGAGDAGGNDGVTGGTRGNEGASGGTRGSDGVAGGMAMEGWTRGSLSVRGADGNAGGMLLGGCFMEGVASARCCTGGALVIR